MTFSEVLRAHAARYPEMREGDFLKLCYQHALGCGHLVKDEAEAVRRIRAERTPGEEGVSFEDIGNGLVRMHLKGTDARFDDETAARMFMYTADTFHPAPDALESALQTLAETFPADAMRAAIAGFPRWAATSTASASAKKCLRRWPRDGRFLIAGLTAAR